MQKPIILITGVPHSFTSMTVKFLLDNGGYCDDTWDNPDWPMDYSRYESHEIQNFLNTRSKFGEYDLKEFFDGLPKDQVVTLKAPMLIFFINELKKFTDREIRVVFVFRNPEDIIVSSLEKSKNKKSFVYYFERLSWLYRFMVQSEFPIFPLISERLFNRDPDTAKRLLDYCDLSKEEINYSSIDPERFKDRKATFSKYRFANFFWKRLAKFFRAI